MMGVSQEQRPIRSDVSVIVSAFEGFSALPLVLLGLARQTVLPAEVLIADDGSNGIEGPRSSSSRGYTSLVQLLCHSFEALPA